MWSHENANTQRTGDQFCLIYTRFLCEPQAKRKRRRKKPTRNTSVVVQRCWNWLVTFNCENYLILSRWAINLLIFTFRSRYEDLCLVLLVRIDATTIQFLSVSSISCCDVWIFFKRFFMYEKKLVQLKINLK